MVDHKRSTVRSKKLPKWRLLSIDDSQHVHDTYAAIFGHDLKVDPRLHEMTVLVEEQDQAIAPPIYFEMERALSGKEGFLKVKQALAEERPYAVILLDMRMPPGWSGLKAAKMIRSVDKDVRIIFCTAYSDYNLEQIRKEVGLDFDYFKKPVDAKRLLQTALSLAGCWDRFQALEEKPQMPLQPLGEFDHLHEGLMPSALEPDKHTFVSVTDAEGKIIYVNKLFCQVTGYSSSELIGKNHRIIKSDEHPAEYFQQMWETILQGEVWYGDIKDRRKNGTCFWSRSMIIPVMGEEDKPVKFISLKYDLADVQWMEREMQMTHAFEEADRKRLSIVSDILDMSKIESGNIELNEAPYSLNVLLADIEHNYSTRAHDAGLDLLVRHHGKEQFRLNGDVHRIAQIIGNLMDNAIEFTDHGVITLSCKHDEKHLSFRVEDTGCGMSKKRLKQLMQQLHKVDQHDHHHFEGSGLGLFVAFNLAELMGGTIDATSQEGVGSIFRLNLPYRLSDLPLVQEVDGANGELLNEPAAGQVLVAEDVPFMQMLEKRLLEQVGASVKVVDNGEEAVKQALQYPFDLILMDMEMPVMDGIEATRVLRDQGCDTPIIALTAYTEARYQDAFFEAGCDGFLSKPIDNSELRYVIRQYLLKHFPTQTDDALMVSFVEHTSRSKESMMEALEAMDWEQMRARFNHVRRTPTASHYVEEMITRLEVIYSSYARNGYNLIEDIEELADEVIEKLQQSADLFIGVIHLYTHFPYPIMRTIQNTVFAVLTALRLEWNEGRIRSLSRACLTQNLGLYPLQTELSEVQGELSNFHRMHIRLHPKNSAKALIKMGVSDRIWLNGVAYHHERMDGSGYPHAYMGKDIPLEARLMAIADRYGSMISPRRYRNPGSPRAIMQQFLSGKKSKYDVRLSKALIAELGIYPPGTTVELVSGETALVTRRGRDSLHPEVMAVWDEEGRCYEHPVKRDVEALEYNIVAIKRHKDAGRLNADRFWGERADGVRQPLFRS